MEARNHVIFLIVAFFFQSTGVLAAIEQCQRQYNCTTTSMSCGPQAPDVNGTVLVHTVVTSDTTNTMHYLWGGAGYPTFMLAEAATPVGGSCNESLDFLKVNVPEYVKNQKEGSVNLTSFSFNSNYSFALILRSLVEFSVKDSEANSSFCPHCLDEDFWSSESFNCSTNKNDPSQTYCIRPLVDVEWGYMKDDRMIGALYDEFNGTEDFVVLFDPKASNGHEGFFPMPFYTPTSAVLDIILSSVSYNISGKHSRLALEVLLVHGPAVSGGGISQRYSADDEYTPSVFYTTIYNIEQNESSSPGYVSWKGISYLDEGRVSSSSQQMSYNPDPAGSKPLQDFKLPESLASAVYGDTPVEVKRMFLVFGTNGADLDLNAPYFTCTAVLGVGQPAVETLSPVVIIVIIVGFGVPGAVVLLGVVFIVTQKLVWRPLRRLRRKRTGYAPL